MYLLSWIYPPNHFDPSTGEPIENRVTVSFDNLKDAEEQAKLLLAEYNGAQEIYLYKRYKTHF